VSDCVLALGFEKMQRGSLKSYWDDRTNPMDKHMEVMLNQRGFVILLLLLDVEKRRQMQIF
jgi:hypothetical protein